MPWLVVSAVVIVWTDAEDLVPIGEAKVPWPGLHNAVFITLYNDKPYARGLGLPAARDRHRDPGRGDHHGAARAAVAVGDSSLHRRRPGEQTRIAILTVMLIVGLAYLMNYSGHELHARAWASPRSGALFPLLSAFLGWVAVFLSGSDTSGNALFGNLQVVAAQQLNLNPVLFAATNSSGGVMGKMISPQNIATGVSTTDLRARRAWCSRAPSSTASSSLYCWACSWWSSSMCCPG